MDCTPLLKTEFQDLCRMQMVSTPGTFQEVGGRAGSGALWKPEAASRVGFVFLSGSITLFVAEPFEVMLICAG